MYARATFHSLVNAAGGEPAQYILTLSQTIGVKLLRRRVGEPQGMVVASSETNVVFVNSDLGASESFFTIGRMPPDGNWSNCEIEQCVIWGRVLSGTELQLINSDPYFIPAP